MKNIFENAKFGDKFRTRDGRMAIFIQTYKGNYELRHELCIDDREKGRKYYLYKDDGSFFHKKCGEDIISHWKEPINEEELDRLADKLNPNNPHGDTYEVGQYFGFQDGFSVGYRKAKEE